MKNKGLIWLLLGAGALFLIAAKKKPKGRVIVSEPEKITREQFEKPSLIQKAAPIVKKITQVVKKRKGDRTKQKAIEAFVKKFGKRSQVGNFPDIY